MDLARHASAALDLCAREQDRLLETARGLDDAAVRAPSLLPGWTRAHVLAHVTRNADGHARRVEGALRGEDVPRYPGGSRTRDADIERGADRPAAEIVADLEAAMAGVLAVLRAADAAGWPGGDLMAEDEYPVTACPSRRLREVVVHHADLGLGYTSADWPQEYVDWDIANLLHTVPERMTDPAHRASLLTWLQGRGEIDPGWRLESWG